MTEHFAVTVNPAHRQPNHFDLHVTHNGYQGYVITLAKDEIPLVIQALQAALTATSQEGQHGQ